jgi:signal transduction histidine kinase
MHERRVKNCGGLGVVAMITVMSRIPNALSASGRRDHAGRWPRHHWVMDAAIMAATFGFSSLFAFAGSTISPLPVWAGVLLTAALVAPLAVRRTWPVAVFAWCFALAAATGWWAMQIVWSPALLVALYSIAAARARRAALVAAALLAVAAVAASRHVLAGGWVESAIALVACVIAALGLGLYSAARHALVAELRERARRLEYERDQQGQLAAAAERARIAREMHDIVAHHLTAIVALAGGASAQVRRTPERAEAAMAEIASTGRLALRDTRQLLGVLREDDAPAALAPLTEDISVDQLIERVRSTGLAVRYETVGDASAAGSAVRLCVYRVIQEALTNTMKHAGHGARATVRVQYAPAEIRVLAEDDGQGTAPLPLPPSGHGLEGMRERVRAFGGDVSSGPRAPHGWTVSARLPVSEAT